MPGKGLVHKTHHNQDINVAGQTTDFEEMYSYATDLAQDKTGIDAPEIIAARDVAVKLSVLAQMMKDVGSDVFAFFPEQEKELSDLIAGIAQRELMKREGVRSVRVDVDFDETISTIDTVQAWARMIKDEQGYSLDDYAQRKKAYAKEKIPDNLAGEYSFFAGRPVSDLKKLAEKIELNQKFIETIRTIKAESGVGQIRVKIVSIGLKNIIDAFLDREDIKQIFAEEGIVIDEVVGNELAVADGKLTAGFCRPVIIGSQKIGLADLKDIYVGDFSDEKNFAGKHSFLINVYKSEDEIRKIIRSFLGASSIGLSAMTVPEPILNIESGV